MDQRPLLVLCVPRSVSTAFDRMLRERGDLHVLTEPFSRAYYDGPERISDRDPGEWADDRHRFAAVLADVLEARDRRVAIKDMAYQLGPLLRGDVLARFEVSFITRDPARAIPSLVRMGPDSTEEENGFAAQRRAFDVVAEATGRPPLVLDASDVLADPPAAVAAWCRAVGLPYLEHALSWRRGPVAGWERWRPWFARAEQSTGFGPPETEMVQVPDGLEELVRRARVHHQHLLAHGARVS